MVSMDIRPSGFGEASAMASTPADFIELPKSYQLFIELPGLGAGDIKVQLDDDNMLVVAGEWKRSVEEEKVTKYLTMERKMGEFSRKFSLPENASPSAISAVCKDGLLTVTVKKLPPPVAKKHRTVHVQVAGGHVDFKKLLMLNWAKLFEG